MKKGLNKMDIAKYHKWLKIDIPIKAIARKLHTTVDVLEKLTPEKFAIAQASKKKNEKAALRHRDDQRNKASMLAETAAQLLNTPAPKEPSDPDDIAPLGQPTTPPAGAGGGLTP